MPDRGDMIQTAERLVARGRYQQAVKTYRRLIDSEPEDTTALNRLGDLYVRLEQVDEAVDLFRKIAEHYAADGFFVKAIAIYKKILRLDPTQFDVYEILAGLYHRQGLVSEARTQYEAVADYFRKHDDLGGAIRIQQKMTELEPERVTHRIRLAELYQKGSETGSALRQYRKIADLMVRHDRIDDAVKVYARALGIGAGDLAFVTDSVLGLREKGYPDAARRVLEAAVELNPEAARVARLAGLVDGQEDDEEVVVDGVAPVPPPLEAPAPTEDDEVAEPPTVAVASPETPVPETAESDESEGDDGYFELDLDAAPPDLGDLEAAAEEIAALDLEQVHPDLRESSGSLELELDLESLEPDVGPVSGDLEAPEAALDLDALERSADEVEGRQEIQGEEDLMAEAEVLIKYGLEDKALERLAELLHRQPRHLEARAQRIRVLLGRGEKARVLEEAGELERLSKLLALPEPWVNVRQEIEEFGLDPAAPPDRAEAIEPEVVAPETPAIELFEEVESAASGGAEADEGDSSPDVVVVPEADLEWLEVEPPVSPDERADDQLFEDENQFFDLAAELERELDDGPELTTRSAAGEIPAEQTLEQIVAGFKKGVEESLSPEDYDTHYNLGIAYREMGLLDEAIGEFQLAAKDSRYLADCCSMLGLCFLDKGFPELAIKWYRRGADSASVGEMERLGLLYELGSLHVDLEEPAAAREVFIEVYGINSNYRDVVARLEELRDE